MGWAEMSLLLGRHPSLFSRNPDYWRTNYRRRLVVAGRLEEDEGSARGEEGQGGSEKGKRRKATWDFGCRPCLVCLLSAAAVQLLLGINPPRELSVVS